MKVKELAEVLEVRIQKGVSLDVAIAEIEDFLKSRKAEQVLPSVLQTLLRKLEAQSKTKMCRIKTAHETSDVLLAQIAATLGGKEYEHTIDQELIGGFTALHNHRLIDASTRRHVTNLEHTLT